MESITREGPLPFSQPMIAAILAGRKNKTRRIFKGKAIGEFENICRVTNGLPKNQLNRWGAMFVDKSDPNHPVRHFTPSPYGGPGDMLYVKETHFVYGGWTFSESIGGKTRWSFQADKNEPVFFCDNFPDVYEFETGISTKIGYYRRSSLFMFKDYARIWLKVTGLRVERLQDISEADARAEGYPGTDVDGKHIPWSPIGWFMSLWKSINNGRTGCKWDDNHWVWVVEFERVDRPKAAKDG